LTSTNREPRQNRSSLGEPDLDSVRRFDGQLVPLYYAGAALGLVLKLPDAIPA